MMNNKIEVVPHAILFREVGYFIVTWSNTESAFCELLRLALGTTHEDANARFSRHHHTSAKLQLIRDEAHHFEDGVRKRALKLKKRFEKLAVLRNKLVHSEYEVRDGWFTHLTPIGVGQNGQLLDGERIDVAFIKSVHDAADAIGKINVDLWTLIHEIKGIPAPPGLGAPLK